MDSNKLIYWNNGESFPSLGIGHFIWYPNGVNERYIESFPLFIKYLQMKNVKVPDYLKHYAPWKSAKDMKNDPNLNIVKSFLLNSMNYQASFMRYRLDNSLKKLNIVKDKYDLLASKPNGYYILIDYLNFKGLGDNPKERYNNQGWGLIDVLKCIRYKYPVKKEFRRCAKKLLKIRINNAPKNKNERKWIKGWYNRIETYR